MDNFEQLQELHSKEKKLLQHIDRIDSIDFIGQSGLQDFIGITKDDNRRYTFRSVMGLIGKDKMNSILESFKANIKAEIIQAKYQNELEINKFQIIKNETLPYDKRD